MDMISRSGPRQRAGMARQLLARDNDVEQRNRSLYIAFRLLEGNWDSEKTQRWSFTHLQELDNPSFSDEIDSTLRRNVEERIAEARDDTPSNFEELQRQTHELQKKFMAVQGKKSDEMDAEDHRQWFYRYAPYLTLNLPKPMDQAGMDGAMEEARRRLVWFEKFFDREKDKNIRDHIRWMGWGRIVDWRREKIQNTGI
uniref:Uncharacterized protein n=1 Tax=Candidatus Kentrum sp. FW TaxID=2126338 RepID=A0A450T8I0_9GAMM|nr:MAG: hypothetical protein BECKFW1821C_GA0114237_100368 [Candidatus Kentron sp. FW]